MKRLVFLLLALPPALSAWAQNSVVERIKNGDKQTIVVYGTRLGALPDGDLTWPAMLQDSINRMYPNSVEVINAAQSGMWSTWGVQNLDARVLEKHPDMVLIEFGINDAYLPYKTSVETCRINVEYMIDRIQESYPDCEIVLHVMNMPIREHLESRPNIEQYYDVYRKLARKRTLKLIDHCSYGTEVVEQGEEHFRTYVPNGQPTN